MSTAEKIKKQIEFYFSNANMRTDKFLQTKTKENDGWIDIDTLLLFSKLKALSTDPETIKNAIKESDVVEIKVDDKLHVRKIVNEEYLNYLKNDNDKKVLVVKGFDTTATFEEIEKCLSEHFEFVIMRMVKDKQKKFVGIVFVELKNEEDIEKVLAMKIPVEKKEVNEQEKEEKENNEDDKEESVKKQKIDKSVLTNYLSIYKKLDYFKDRQAKQKMDKETQKRENILGQLKGKFYRYTASKEVDIKGIKKIVENVAFVDMKNKTLRFKKSQDFEEKTFELEDTKIDLKRLTDEEEAEYVKDIKFSDVLSKGKRKPKVAKK